MRILICFIITLTIGTSFSQEKFDYLEIRTALENSSKSLNTTILLPNSDFHIGTTLDMLIENPELNPCIDIQSNSEKNARVISVLNKHRLLDKLYIEINNQYIDISSDQIFKPNKTQLYLELFFKTRDFGFVSCFVPVINKNSAKELIEDLSKIFDNKYCFKKLNRKM